MIKCPVCGTWIEHEGTKLEKWPLGARYEVFCNFCKLKITIFEDEDGGKRLSY
ncbi:hypothetical protein [Methanococcus vannielii]|uniref:hypothetical protein n=1 Tax=Methanococcus vannielii TaxID=2187 RepID=UPI000B1AC6DE|nr:hypothetical protein [Methanococcus vannielii]